MEREGEVGKRKLGRRKHWKNGRTVREVQREAEGREVGKRMKKERGRAWRLGGGEPGGGGASLHAQAPPLLSPPLVPTQAGSSEAQVHGDQAAGCRLEPAARGLGLCLAPPSLPLTWWFALHLVCGAAGPALGV